MNKIFENQIFKENKQNLNKTVKPGKLPKTAENRSDLKNTKNQKKKLNRRDAIRPETGLGPLRNLRGRDALTRTNARQLGIAFLLPLF
jgi:hypothetical protein